MPLGFGKSVFTTTAPAAGADPGYWQNAGTTSAGANGASLIMDPGSGNFFPINAKEMVGSIWFKGTTSDIDGSAMIFRQLTETDGGFFWEITSTGVILFFQETSGGNKGFTSFPANFSTDYWDDQWHHIAVATDANPSTGTGDTRLYMDGVSQTVSASDYSSAVAISQHRYGRHNGSDNTTSDTNTYVDSRVSTVQFSQFYMDFTTIDLDSNISKFYDGGYVDMGTDGTGSGLTQPDLFMYQTGGSIADGGTLATTISVVNEGTGSYTYSETGGPS